MKIATGKYIQGGELSGVRVPFKAEIKAGDLLDFDQAAHVLHPVTWQIHKVSGVEVNTGAVVLDVADGEKIATKRSTPIPYFYPGEILVLDADGNIELRNDLEDRGQYIAATLEKDEEASYGKRRRNRKKLLDPNDIDGSGGGGMGTGSLGGSDGGRGSGGDDPDEAPGGRGGGR